MQKSERTLREEVVEVCRRLHRKGFITASDGNVSVKLGGGRLLFTPSGVNKGFIRPEELVVTDMAGRKLSGTRNPSSEIRMHLRVYERRPEVEAVVHAHPPISIACTIAGVSLTRCILPEVVMTLGSIPTTQYATPTSAQGPEVINDLIDKFDGLILDRHGTLTVGRDLFQAYDRQEKIEHTAEVTLYAKQFGKVTLIPCDEVSRLEDLSRELGLYKEGRTAGECDICGDACRLKGDQPGEKADAPESTPEAALMRRASVERPAPEGGAEEENLVRTVTEAVLAELGLDRGE